jgi:hypothetical protein
LWDEAAELSEAAEFAEELEPSEAGGFGDEPQAAE